MKGGELLFEYVNSMLSMAASRNTCWVRAGTQYAYGGNPMLGSTYGGHRNRQHICSKFSEFLGFGCVSSLKHLAQQVNMTLLRCWAELICCCCWFFDLPEPCTTGFVSSSFRHMGKLQAISTMVRPDKKVFLGKMRWNGCIGMVPRKCPWNAKRGNLWSLLKLLTVWPNLYFLRPQLFQAKYITKNTKLILYFTI